MRKLLLAFIGILSVTIGSASGQTHTAGTPVLSSDPGAPFTLYLDFAGFNYTGTWSSAEKSQPGSTPALNLNGEATNIPTFTAADDANIDTIWSRVA
jgi:hypothetical protein